MSTAKKSCVQSKPNHVTVFIRKRAYCAPALYTAEQLNTLENEVRSLKNP